MSAQISVTEELRVVMPISEYLKHAGVKDWQTWKNQHGQSQVVIVVQRDKE